MKKAVRENIHYGARVIKIIVNGAGYKYSGEDVQYIVSEAARSGASTSS